MTTPTELLAVARELSSDPREAAWRSAASRAYYPAFWHLRALVEERFGALESTGAEVHGELYRATRSWDADLAQLLANLRNARNRADYAPEIRFTLGLSGRCITAAERVLSVE